MDTRNYMKIVPTILAAVSGAIYFGAKAIPATTFPTTGPVLSAVAVFATPPENSISSAVLGHAATAAVTRVVTGSSHGTDLALRARNALDALASSVRQLSHPRALEDAFDSYFAFKAAHPDQVRKPLLYFVDYGLPNTTPRGYVFNMDALSIVDGPFMVAAGRGSAPNSAGVSTRFSNAFGAATTSLGLYVAQEIYQFTGHTGGQAYHSVGLKLAGVSTGFNDNARARRRRPRRAVCDGYSRGKKRRLPRARARPRRKTPPQARQRRPGLPVRARQRLDDARSVDFSTVELTRSIATPTSAIQEISFP